MSLVHDDRDIEIDTKAGSFKEIVMELLRKITVLSSCELRGGYYTNIQTRDGDEKEIYVQDSRESLSNAIYCLSQLTKKVSDEDMKKEFDKFDKERKELKDKFLESTSIKENEVLGEAYYNDKEKILLEEYKIQKLELYKELFTELSKFLSRKNYFEVGGTSFS